MFWGWLVNPRPRPRFLWVICLALSYCASWSSNIFWVDELEIAADEELDPPLLAEAACGQVWSKTHSVGPLQLLHQWKNVCSFLNKDQGMHQFFLEVFWDLSAKQAKTYSILDSSQGPWIPVAKEATCKAKFKILEGLHVTSEKPFMGLIQRLRSSREKQKSVSLKRGHWFATDLANQISITYLIPLITDCSLIMLLPRPGGGAPPPPLIPIRRRNFSLAWLSPRFVDSHLLKEVFTGWVGAGPDDCADEADSWEINCTWRF